jgi:hypothetical protein
MIFVPVRGEKFSALLLIFLADAAVELIVCVSLAVAGNGGMSVALPSSDVCGVLALIFAVCALGLVITPPGLRERILPWLAYGNAAGAPVLLLWLAIWRGDFSPHGVIMTLVSAALLAGLAVAQFAVMRRGGASKSAAA